MITIPLITIVWLSLIDCFLMQRQTHHGKLNLYKALPRFAPAILIESPQEVTSGGIEPNSSTTKLYIQARDFRPIYLTYQYVGT